jgi:hypothetical protein
MVGSQAKRTAVASSDYDLWVDVGDECVSRAQRKVLRNKLTSMLNKGGDPARVAGNHGANTVRIHISTTKSTLASPFPAAASVLKCITSLHTAVHTHNPRARAMEREMQCG